MNRGKPRARVSQPAAPSLRGGFPYLLHVPQHVFPAVEDALPFLRVEVVDEVGGVVLVAPLVPAPGEGDGLIAGGRHEHGMSQPHPPPISFHPGGGTYLSTSPLFTVVFIFSVKCSTLTYVEHETGVGGAWKWE